MIPDTYPPVRYILPICYVELSNSFPLSPPPKSCIFPWDPTPPEKNHPSAHLTHHPKLVLLLSMYDKLTRISMWSSMHARCATRVMLNFPHGLPQTSPIGQLNHTTSNAVWCITYAYSQQGCSDAWFFREFNVTFLQLSRKCQLLSHNKVHF